MKIYFIIQKELNLTKHLTNLEKFYTSIICKTEVLSNIDQHVNQKNKESFFSFQKNKKHECGGARVHSKLVLITSNCKWKIGENYGNIDPVIPALPAGRRGGYKIKDIKSVETSVFHLVIVSNITFYTI